jgi:hypothetical protein
MRALSDFVNATAMPRASEEPGKSQTGLAMPIEEEGALRGV